jgi:hypothetical protein
MKKHIIKRPIHLKINKKRLLLLLGIISFPIIVLLSYFFGVGSFLEATFLTTMEFALIFFAVCYNKFFINKNNKPENIKRIIKLLQYYSLKDENS